MALEDITTRIVVKARQEADTLLRAATERAEHLKAEASRRLARETDQARQKAEEESRGHHARIVATAQLEARKHELVVKRDLITQAVDRALAGIPSAGEERYAHFLRRVLLTAPIRGEADLIVAPRDHAFLRRMLPEFQRELDNAGRGLTLRLSPETREIEGGFVLRQGKIEYNASLAAIKRFREQDLRSAATAALFGDTR
ncbi:MAG: V-type ATP synthase subunit E [Candidatus Eisenbacteria bacterium]|jgi:V/A-type H+-transporting ATPase subunit E|nr:V-type ATP synthase subunit E [Candidatus Eisenbacteria bacterium]